MKRGDMVRVTTGQYTGQTGRVIRVFRGWVDFVRADNRGFQERAELCERIEDDGAQPEAVVDMFARKHMAEVQA